MCFADSLSPIRSFQSNISSTSLNLNEVEYQIVNIIRNQKLVVEIMFRNIYFNFGTNTVWMKFCSAQKNVYWTYWYPKCPRAMSSPLKYSSRSGPLYKSLQFEIMSLFQLHIYQFAHDKLLTRIVVAYKTLPTAEFYLENIGTPIFALIRLQLLIAP